MALQDIYRTYKRIRKRVDSNPEPSILDQAVVAQAGENAPINPSHVAVQKNPRDRVAFLRRSVAETERKVLADIVNSTSRSKWEPFRLPIVAEEPEMTEKERAPAAGSAAPALVKQEAAKEKDAAKPPINSIKDAAKPAINSIKDAAKPAIKGAKDAAKPAINSIKDAAKPAIKGAKDAAKSAINSAKDAAKPAIKGAKDAAKPAINSIKDATKPVIKGDKDAAKPAINSVSGVRKPSEKSDACSGLQGSHAASQFPQQSLVLAEHEHVLFSDAPESDFEDQVWCKTFSDPILPPTIDDDTGL